MATKAEHCAHKGHNTHCPECGRAVPDWCAKDDPFSGLMIAAAPATGSDLEVSQEERQEAAETIETLQKEQAEAQEKIIKRRGRKTQ